MPTPLGHRTVPQERSPRHISVRRQLRRQTPAYSHRQRFRPAIAYRFQRWDESGRVKSGFQKLSREWENFQKLRTNRCAKTSCLLCGEDALEKIGRRTKVGLYPLREPYPFFSE